MREVRGPSVQAGVPDAFLGVDVVVAEVLCLIEAERVEDVELDLRAPERRISDSGRGEKLLSLLGNVTGIARVRLPGERVDHVADQVEGLHLENGVDEHARR